MCTDFSSGELTERNITLGLDKRQNEDLQLPPAPKYFVFLERSTSSQQLCAAEGNPFRAEFFTGKASGVRPSLLHVPQVRAAGIYFSWFPAAFMWS